VEVVALTRVLQVEVASHLLAKHELHQALPLIADVLWQRNPKQAACQIDLIKPRVSQDNSIPGIPGGRRPAGNDECQVDKVKLVSALIDTIDYASAMLLRCIYAPGGAGKPPGPEGAIPGGRTPVHKRQIQEIAHWCR
jgi:hypothetical protein